MLFERQRKIATKVAWSFIGKWYKWGGDDPSGFDCSGFVIEILIGYGDFSKQQIRRIDHKVRNIDALHVLIGADLGERIENIVRKVEEMEEKGEI